MNSYRPIPVPFRLTGQDLLHTGFEPVAADAKQGEIFKAIRINAGMFQSSYMSVRPQRRQMIEFCEVVGALVVVGQE